MASIVDHLFHCREGNKVKMFQLHIDGIKALIKRWLQICTQKDLELHFYRVS